MALINIPFTFSAGAVIVASQHNSDFSTIYSDYNGNIDNTNIATSAAIAYSKLNLANSIVNADINSSAAIVDTKLAQITTAGKVSGAAITSLSSLPSGAGVVPTANLGSGTANGTTVLYGDQTYKTAPAVSNCLFQYMGSIQATEIEGSGATILNATKSAVFIYLVGTSNGSATKYIAKLRKISSFSTVSGVLTLWIQTAGGSRQGQAVMSIGGANSSAMTSGSLTPVQFTWSIDVSGLSNGTDYDVSVVLTDNIGGGNNTIPYCAEISGYAS